MRPKLKRVVHIGKKKEGDVSQRKSGPTSQVIKTHSNEKLIKKKLRLLSAVFSILTDVLLCSFP